MSAEVTCSRCGETGDAIDGRIPFGGELAESVREKICSACWALWQDEQIKVINEFALNLGDPRSHAILESQARDFLGIAEDA
jgi:Fe-S cluster biosynthesis and repair protein YggX